MTLIGKDYNGRIDLSAVHNSQTQLWNLLEEHRVAHQLEHPKVLEIGCNTGYFTELLHNTGYYVHGVEFFCDDAEKNGFTDAFYFGTVEDFLLKDADALKESFDAIVLGDVIEHLQNPEGVLKGLARCLKPDGAFLISVPNITHIRIRQMLADGEWRYVKKGILDNSHVRFFTRHSLRRFLIRAGFGVERAVPILTFSLDTYGLGALHNDNQPVLNEYDHTFQIVVRATRQALGASAFTSPPRKIFLLSHLMQYPYAQLRLLEPLQAYCESVEGELRVGGFCSAEDLRWMDVLVLHRTFTAGMMLAVRKARMLGISIVYDLDELFTSVPPFPSCGVRDEDSRQIRYIISSAERVTCPTPRLQVELNGYSDKTALAPNCMKSKRAVDVQERQGEGACTYVLAASDIVPADQLRYPLGKILAKHPDSSVVIIGPIGQAWQAVKFPATYYPTLAPEVFSELLLSLKNPVGVIPLDESLFSSCKSAIKYYHYSLCGVVTVASCTPPYSDVIKNQETGLLVDNSAPAWIEALESLTTDAKKRQFLLAGALLYCYKFASPERSVQAWKQAFHGLPRPDEDLRSRISFSDAEV